MSHAVLGLITIIAVQRAVHKILIAAFISREFKHDETNRAWWTGRWYGRGLGAHAMSQPAREYFVKIIELSLWSSDFLLGHFLLFILSPPLLVPYIDRLHATMLCELPPILLCRLTNTCDSLVTTFEANPSTAVLAQTEEAAPMDCQCMIFFAYTIY